MTEIIELNLHLKHELKGDLKIKPRHLNSLQVKLVLGHYLVYDSNIDHRLTTLISTFLSQDELTKSLALNDVSENNWFLGNLIYLRAHLILLD